MPSDRPSNVLGVSAERRGRVVARAVTRPSQDQLGSITKGDSGTRLYVRGRIDLAAKPGLRNEFEEAILGACSDVVLDCSDVTFMDGGAILHLVELRDSLAARGRRLGLTALSTDVAQDIELLGLTGMLHTEQFLPTVEMPSPVSHSA